MTYVITGGCCNDASCVDVCPVDCIHPGPAEPGFAAAEMLYIDPKSCIDCGACVDVCPVGAIVPDHALDEHSEVYRAVNAAFFAETTSGKLPAPSPPVVATVMTEARARQRHTLRVAVVGSGPAGCYAAEHLLNQTDLDVEVSMFERLPAPFGLVRYGVAPDHQTTKSVTRLFQRITRRDGFRLFLGCEIGDGFGVDELLAHHHAVIVASGASGDRRLGIPGEDLSGSHAARDLVAWYNGHPDSTDWAPDLSAERAVIVGNGNVALDLARMLVMPPEELRRTDVPTNVADQLGCSRLREVVVLGRRGSAQAAFTGPELHTLTRLAWVDVRIHNQQQHPGPPGTWKASLLHELAARPPRPGLPLITLRFDTAPVAILGGDRVESIRVARTEVGEGPDGGPVVRTTEDVEDLDCGLVLRSVGYRGMPFVGLPFDEARGTLPHRRGRVLTAPGGARMGGVYTAGWLKRGPSGVIGTNRACAVETVGALRADFDAGLLDEPPYNSKDLLDLVDARRPDWIDADGWSAVDRHEQLTGRAEGRPRTKLVARTEFRDVAGGRDLPA